MARELFRGPESLRPRGERTRLALCVVVLPLSLAAIGWVLQSWLSTRALVLVVVAALVFVALGRGRFLGAAVRLGPSHFGEVYAVVADCARRIGIATPHVFLRDDYASPVVAMGTAEPYALAISSQWVDDFSEAELRFVVGRELAQIAAGNAKLTSLMRANGRDNAFVAIAFGSWLRAIEYTADRVGLLCCGSMETALAAMSVATFQLVGRRVDAGAYARQRRELEAEPSLRMGEWLACAPYVTNRVARLERFAASDLYAAWRPRFAPPDAAAEPRATAAPRFAGPLRRLSAFCIDVAVVRTLAPIGALSAPATDPRRLATMSLHLRASHASSGVAAALEWIARHASVLLDAEFVAVTLAVLAVYAIVLVGLAGQTLGMMVADVRVVDLRAGRPSPRAAIVRYACCAASALALFGCLWALARVQPFERLSRTRMVVGNASLRPPPDGP